MTVGEFRDSDSWEPIVFHNEAANTYPKILMDNDRIVGAVVIGRAATSRTSASSRP